METDSQKPKKWMGIANEPNYRFATNRVCVCIVTQRALFACPTYFALPMSHFASPYLAYFILSQEKKFLIHFHTF